jgi:cytochrome P450
MQNALEMTLPELPLQDPAFDRDPMPFVAEARGQHPWLTRFGDKFFIHGYEAIRDILYQDAKLRPAHDDVVETYGAEGTAWADYMEGMMLAQWGPKHAQLRAAMGDTFTPRNVNRHIDLVRGTIADLLDEWIPKRGFDFAEFASYFPIAVLCGLLGTDTSEIPRIKHSLETQTAVLSLNNDLTKDLLEGYDVMWEFTDRLVKDREAAGLEQGKMLDQLILAKNAGQMSEDDLRWTLMLLFPAGYDTSKNMLTLTVYHLLENSGYWERCAEDLTFCLKAVEESFRHTSTATIFRKVTDDIEYDGVRFPKDSVIIFGTSIASRDPRIFDDPMKFDPERKQTNRHLAFGRGAHICLGQHLAKTQIAEGLHQVTQRIKNPRLTGEVRWRPYLGVWGLRSLPIAFEPGEKVVRAEPAQ